MSFTGQLNSSWSKCRARAAWGGAFGRRVGLSAASSVSQWQSFTSGTAVVGQNRRSWARFLGAVRGGGGRWRRAGRAVPGPRRRRRRVHPPGGAGVPRRGGGTWRWMSGPLSWWPPGTAGDVAQAVRFACARGMRVAPQGTGHGAPPPGPLGDAVLLTRGAGNWLAHQASMITSWPMPPVMWWCRLRLTMRSSRGWNGRIGSSDRTHRRAASGRRRQLRPGPVVTPISTLAGPGLTGVASACASRSCSSGP
jgi:hypothetical protein